MFSVSIDLSGESSFHLAMKYLNFLKHSQAKELKIFSELAFRPSHFFAYFELVFFRIIANRID